jgi:serine/threonine protein kinase
VHRDVKPANLLLDREGIKRWSFTEVADGGKNLFGAPTPQDLMSAASRVAAGMGFARPRDRAYNCGFAVGV